MKKILFIAMLLVLCGSIFAITMPERAGSLIRTEDLVITVSGTDVLITWNAVPNAISYKVYSALTPEADFVEDLTGTFSEISGGMSWSASVDGARRFYHVTSLTAGDVPPMPENFIFVEGGAFNGYTAAAPFLTAVSSFYMDKYEVTQADYFAIMGVVGTGFGVGDNYPAYLVTWFAAIEYCNLRSIEEGLEPCYSYGTDGTDVDRWPDGWNTADANHTNVSCDWTANGYRLPTEMEWKFAAKGGILANDPPYTYSGSNDANDVAWYNSNSGRLVHEVGTKAANELGFHDMSGNVYEWCWDMGTSPYPTEPVTDYHGPENALYRLRRGGCAFLIASMCNINSQVHGLATLYREWCGLRVVRNCP